MTKPTVVIGFLGSTLDAGAGARRWDRWRPSVSLCQHDDLLVQRFELLHQRPSAGLARQVERDVRAVSPETQVVTRELDLGDAWDFESVFAALHAFARGYPFDPEREDYLVHITTGTHVAQICLFLLTESRHFPARLVQTSPPRARSEGVAGSFAIIDLDLSRYDRLAARFERERSEAASILKSGIVTRSPNFNELIERLERIVLRSRAPILLTGPTGAGKSQLAARIYELKKARRQLSGAFVELNCATLRGDAAQSTLFGHVKGAFTGALQERPGLLRAADGGLLFLDEIGELGLDEQALLLRALETGRFYPLGGDREVESRFELVAGTNRDLQALVHAGRFREDLLARIDLWTFRLPGLRERPEDIEPNLDYELERQVSQSGRRASFSREARAAFLAFATSPEARWERNFRDLAGAVARLSTLAPGGRISTPVVAAEIARLRASWRHVPPDETAPGPARRLLGPDAHAGLDLFDRLQLDAVLRVAARCRSLSEAGRVLFAASQARRASRNDADRLRKYLARFGLSWARVVELGASGGD